MQLSRRTGVLVGLPATVLLTVGPALTAWAQPAAPEGPWQLPMAISEVYPLPVEGEATWVELLNYGEEAVSIAEWCLADKGGVRYAFPEDLPAVPPQGIVLVAFGGEANPPADDTSFGDDNAGSLYSRTPETVTAFRGESNECALYASPQPTPEAMVQYVYWGDWQDTAQGRVARDLCLWDSSRGVTLTELKPGDEGLLLPGHSIGRAFFRKPRWFPERQMVVTGGVCLDWVIYVPAEVTGGRRNGWPSPVLLDPWPGIALHRDWRPWFAFHAAWNRMDPGWRGHFRVATDPDFRNVVLEGSRAIGEPSKPPPLPPLPPGRYYWTARLERGDQSTPWAPPNSFEILPD